MHFFPRIKVSECCGDWGTGRWLGKEIWQLNDQTKQASKQKKTNN